MTDQERRLTLEPTEGSSPVGTADEAVVWKELLYEAGRRSRVEVEIFLTAFLGACQAQGWSDLTALRRLVGLEDPDLYRAILTGNLPESFPEALRTAWSAFVRRWSARRDDPTPSASDLAALQRTGPLQAGEWVLLIDAKGRHYLTRLEPGQNFTFHLGSVPMDAIIGQTEGTALRSSKGHVLLVFRPTLRDYLLHMPRHAQVVYPKDSAIMAMWGDLYPGARVLESGLGSGALAMVILRAIGPTGRLVSYEIRADFIRRAVRNIERWLGYIPENHEIHNEDIARAQVEPGSFDRAFLDLPTPTDGLPVATGALRPGGILVSISPTVPQVQETVEWLRASNLYGSIEVLEVLVRPWNVKGHSVRPAHFMVAHTAFIVVARRLRPGQSFVDDVYI